MALADLSQVDKRFFDSAKRFAWKYLIAREYSISPREVETWDAEEVMEAMADINLNRRSNKGNPAWKGVRRR